MMRLKSLLIIGLICLIACELAYTAVGANPSCTPSYTPTLPPTTASSVSPSVSPAYYPSLSPHSISVVSTIAGTGTGNYSGDGGQATSATINLPHGIALDSSGNVYFNDYYNHRVRKITASTGIITTYAGTGSTSYSGDGGVASSAALYRPNGLCIDTSDNIYIGDQFNNRVRKIAISSSIISTIAGTGATGYNGDNTPASSASLYGPIGVAVDASGNVYIADKGNNRIRKVTASTGLISTIAGTGTAGYSGNNGQATAAMIKFPHGINLDNSLNVYFGDCCGGYNVVRKLTVSTGIITTVAGTGSTSGGYNGDNIQATAASLNEPTDVLLDSYNNLYICDRYNHRVRKIDTSTGVITTVVGTGTSSSTGDGSAASSATVNEPNFSRFDSSGNWYITERDGNRVRKVVTVSTDIPSAAPSMVPSVTPTAVPSTVPTVAPSAYPSSRPTGEPSSIPTSSTPTTIPTSTPTSNPTVTNLITLNVLDTPLTTAVVREKTKYYIGLYIVYFLSWYVLLYLAGFSRIGKDKADELYELSHKSSYYKACARHTVKVHDGASASTLDRIYKNNKKLKEVLILDDEIRIIKIEKEFANTTDDLVGDPFDDPFSTDEEDPKAATSGGPKAPVKSINSKLNRILLKNESVFSRGFREYLNQNRCLLGCKPIYYPNGVDINLFFTSIKLPPGRFEDFVLYLCSNHPFFNNFYYIKGSRLGRHGTKLTYMGKDVSVFVLSLMFSMIVNYYGINNSVVIDTVINIAVIAPLSIFIGLFLVYLYTCPCTESVGFQRHYSNFQGFILCLGRASVAPILLLISISLFLACLFSNKASISGIVLNYLWNVQLYGIFYEIFLGILAYVDNYHLNLTVLGVNLLNIGNLYCEKIVYDDLVMNRDYAVRVWNYWLICVEVILNRDDALRRGWIKEEKATELTVTTNPVIVAGLAIDEEKSVEKEEGIEDVFDTNHDVCDSSNEVITSETLVRVSYSNVYDVAKAAATETETETETATASQQVYIIQHVVNPLSAMSNAMLSRSSDVTTDDSALYLEYQNEVNGGIHPSNAKNDTNDYDFTEEILSFEEWKIKKREFKKGTRGSFVR